MFVVYNQNICCVFNTDIFQDLEATWVAETKQLIPDKNLFGHSNAFDVVIQLARSQHDIDAHAANNTKTGEIDINDVTEIIDIILVDDETTKDDTTLHRTQTNNMPEGQNSSVVSTR